MWYVYIIRCSNNALYTGSTTDISRRIKEHNSGKGGYYTRAHTPVELVYQQEHANRVAAQRREAQIKHLSRHEKLALIGM